MSVHLILIGSVGFLIDSVWILIGSVEILLEKKHFERKVYVMDLACGMFIGSCIVKQIQVMKYSKTCGSVFLWIVYRVLLSQDNFYNACITPLSMSIYQNPMNKQFMLWVGYTNCLSDTMCACAGFLSLSVNAYCVKFLYQIHHVRKCTVLGSSWPQSLMRIAYYQHCVAGAVSTHDVTDTGFYFFNNSQSALHRNVE